MIELFYLLWTIESIPDHHGNEMPYRCGLNHKIKEKIKIDLNDGVPFNSA